MRHCVCMALALSLWSGRQTDTNQLYSWGRHYIVLKNPTGEELTWVDGWQARNFMEKRHLDLEHSKKEGCVSVKEHPTVPFQAPTTWIFSLPDGQSPFFITLLTFLHLLYLCPNRWRILPHSCYPDTMQYILPVFFPKNKHPQLRNCGLNQS